MSDWSWTTVDEKRERIQEAVADVSRLQGVPRETVRKVMYAMATVGLDAFAAHRRATPERSADAGEEREHGE